MAEKSLKSFQLEKTLEKSDCSVQKSAVDLTGHECEFVDKPPNRSECPICLLVLREPHQATCCGKIFCKACICKIRDKEHPCPICKIESFSCYPDKGLQQELYSCRVYCPKKTGGCDWKGELWELDQHLNFNPEEGRKMEGCEFVDVYCLYCCGLYQRCLLNCHQSAECVKRSFTCEMCQEYESTYNDVVLLHIPTCKCRPVDCPNQCGDALQHQELEQHLSNSCVLVEVECEFVHAGCEAKMHRKDLSSHLRDNMVTHISLLAAENRQLKSQLENGLRSVEKSVESLEVGKQLVNRYFSRMPPLHIRYPWKEYAPLIRKMGYQVINTNEWYSEPFYTHFRGYKLCLKVWCTTKSNMRIHELCLSYAFIGNEFPVKASYIIFITTLILDLESGTSFVRKRFKITHLESESLKITNTSTISNCFKKDNVEICVERIEVINM